MRRVILEKEVRVIRARLSATLIFSDYCQEYFTSKVDNHKVLQNLYWHALLTAEKKSKNFLVLGNQAHDHAAYQELNNRSGHIARLVSPHPRDLYASIQEADTNTRLLTCGTLSHIKMPMHKNDLLALREIWPKTQEISWRCGLDTLARKSFLSRFQEQFLLSETSGQLKVKRSFYGMRKAVSRISHDSDAQRRSWKTPSLDEFHDGWSAGILNLNQPEDVERELKLTHLRYTGDSVDFLFTSHLSNWLTGIGHTRENGTAHGDQILHLTSTNPVISGFIYYYLTDNQHFKEPDIILSDVLFGNNFSASYLSFLSEQLDSMMIDLNHFPDIYIWQSREAHA